MSTKRRTPPAPTPAKRENRVMLSFSDEDYADLTTKAKEAGVPLATYARLVIRGKAPPLVSA